MVTKVEHKVPGMSCYSRVRLWSWPWSPMSRLLSKIAFLSSPGRWQLLPLLPTFLFWFPQNSVTRSAPVNSDSQGRCGARFLTTYDRRFVIKAVSSEDVAEMHNILKKYHQVR